MPSIEVISLVCFTADEACPYSSVLPSAEQGSPASWCCFTESSVLQLTHDVLMPAGVRQVAEPMPAQLPDAALSCVAV